MWMAPAHGCHVAAATFVAGMATWIGSMTDANKKVLLAANAAISVLDIEGFLQHCADDIRWHAVGEQVIEGKTALRQWMNTTYLKPPQFSVTDLIAEDDHVVAVGRITVEDASGATVPASYSDVWRFRDGRMAELTAFVVPTPRGG